jgi:DHA1 family bicyclomycin/chloramphenicol resistance-like MFS transporter
MSYPAWLPILLGFLTAVGPATTDMYLPAFPSIEASFGAPAGSAQLTLAAWFAGLAVGQMTQGTLSDRFGRKRPLIVATAVYTLACLGCALAPSIQWLAAFRALAAIGASAGMVIPRAMVRDLAEGHAAAVLLSRLSLVMGAAPILAPVLGSAVLAFAEWRGIFWILTAYGVACWVLVVALLPDTLAEERRIRLRFGEQLARYRSILAERGFLTHATMGAFATFAFFAYLGGSSPVFIQGFGLTPVQYALRRQLVRPDLLRAAQPAAVAPVRTLARTARGLARAPCRHRRIDRDRLRRPAYAAAGHRAGVRGDKLHGHVEPQHHRGRTGAAAASRRQRVLGDGDRAIHAGRVQRPDGGAGD